MEDCSHVHGLEELSSAVRYRRYLFDLISPWCGRRVLEVGAGLGDFAALFGLNHEVLVTDQDPVCLAALERRFKDKPLRLVLNVDLLEPLELPHTVDSIVAINVLEHIDDHVAALRNFKPTLNVAGNVIVFVPAYPSLYGPFDRAVGHVRRYTQRSLRATVEEAGFHVLLLRPVNMIGGIAWWLAVKLGKRSRPRPMFIRLYDFLLVPLVRLMERMIRPPFGQSLICVATQIQGTDT